MKKPGEDEKQNVPPPILCSVIVCRFVITDAKTKRPSIIDVVRVITARKFPALFPSLTLFFELTNGRGEVQVSVKLVNMKDEHDLLGQTAGYKVRFEDPRQVRTLILPVPRISFPHAGEYRFEFYVNNELIGQRRIVCKEK